MEEEKYLPELMAEKDSLDPSFVHASRLLAEGRTCPRTWAQAMGRPSHPRLGEESEVGEGRLSSFAETVPLKMLASEPVLWAGGNAPTPLCLNLG